MPKKWSKSEVSKLTIRTAKSGYARQVVAVLADYGVKSAKMLEPEDVPEYVAKIQAIVEKGVKDE